MIRNLGYENGKYKVTKTFIPYLINMPEAPNDTVQFRGWVSDSCLLRYVRALSVISNSNGSYILSVYNTTQSESILDPLEFDMNSLSNDIITEIPITDITGYKTFNSLDRWTIELTSDSETFNGSGIYIELVFEAI